MKRFILALVLGAYSLSAQSALIDHGLGPHWFVVEPEQLTMLRGFIAYHVVALSIYFVLRHFKIE